MNNAPNFEAIKLLSDISTEFDLPGTPLSIAAKAHQCAIRTVDCGDRAAQIIILEEGWNRRLSREYSRQRRTVKDALDRQAKGQLPMLEVQLKFPIIAPGFPPTPLGKSTNELILWAMRSEKRQIRGKQRSVEIMEPWEVATRPYPGIPVDVLIERGLINEEDLMPELAKRKAA